MASETPITEKDVKKMKMTDLEACQSVIADEVKRRQEVAQRRRDKKTRVTCPVCTMQVDKTEMVGNECLACRKNRLINELFATFQNGEPVPIPATIELYNVRRGSSSDIRLYTQEIYITVGEQKFILTGNDCDECNYRREYQYRHCHDDFYDRGYDYDYNQAMLIKSADLKNRE